MEEKRRKLVIELEKKRVLWQAQAESRWLALLANEKAVAPLLRFLKVTNVGERESQSGCRKRSSRWIFAWVNSGGDNPKVTVIHNGKINKKYKNKGDSNEDGRVLKKI